MTVGESIAKHLMYAITMPYTGRAVRAARTATLGMLTKYIARPAPAAHYHRSRFKKTIRSPPLLSKRAIVPKPVNFHVLIVLSCRPPTLSNKYFLSSAYSEQMSQIYVHDVSFLIFKSRNYWENIKYCLYYLYTHLNM